MLPCCAASACDVCTRDSLVATPSICPLDECDADDVNAEDLIPNRLLRKKSTEFREKFPEIFTRKARIITVIAHDREEEIVNIEDENAVQESDENVKISKVSEVVEDSKSEKKSPFHDEGVKDDDEPPVPGEESASQLSDLKTMDDEKKGNEDSASHKVDIPRHYMNEAVDDPLTAFNRIMAQKDREKGITNSLDHYGPPPPAHDLPSAYASDQRNSRGSRRGGFPPCYSCNDGSSHPKRYCPTRMKGVYDRQERSSSRHYSSRRKDESYYKDDEEYHKWKRRNDASKRSRRSRSRERKREGSESEKESRGRSYRKKESGRSRSRSRSPKVLGSKELDKKTRLREDANELNHPEKTKSSPKTKSKSRSKGEDDENASALQSEGFNPKVSEETSNDAGIEEASEEPTVPENNQKQEKLEPGPNKDDDSPKVAIEEVIREVVESCKESENNHENGFIEKSDGEKADRKLSKSVDGGDTKKKVECGNGTREDVKLKELKEYKKDRRDSRDQRRDQRSRSRSPQRRRKSHSRDGRSPSYNGRKSHSKDVESRSRSGDLYRYRQRGSGPSRPRDRSRCSKTRDRSDREAGHSRSFRDRGKRRTSDAGRDNSADSNYSLSQFADIPSGKDLTDITKKFDRKILEKGDSESSNRKSKKRAEKPSKKKKKRRWSTSTDSSSDSSSIDSSSSSVSSDSDSDFKSRNERSKNKKRKGEKHKKAKGRKKKKMDKATKSLLAALLLKDTSKSSLKLLLDSEDSSGSSRTSKKLKAKTAGSKRKVTLEPKKDDITVERSASKKKGKIDPDLQINIINSSKDNSVGATPFKNLPKTYKFVPKNKSSKPLEQPSKEDGEYSTSGSDAEPKRNK